VKRTADKLISLHKKSFTNDFNKNKVKVAELSDVSSKRLRNQIAGYLTKKLKSL
jgi:small subunit ribosomal protein S17e